MRAEGFASLHRKSILYFIISAIFGVLIFRLFQMQIIEQASYNTQSTNNSIKSVEETPLRGIFYDRNMNVVVSNIPAYTLRITPADYNRKLNNLIETVIGVDSGYIDKILYDNRMYSKYLPIRIKRGIEFKVVSWLEENSENLPGVDYVVEMQRGYPAGIRGSQMFGYTREITPRLLDKNKDYYKPGDFIGYNGIEKTYENILRGEKGYDYVLVDSRRRVISKFDNGKNDIPSIKGNDLVLSIDENLQKVAEEQLKGKRGAVVAIDPKTGEVLAMASSPDYDLSKFSYVTSRDYLSKLYNDSGKPLFNRATMSAKPPGSTIKPLEAIAALDLGVITPSTTFFCPGYFTYGRVFKCDAVHGTLNVVHAIEKSCNVFFYNLIYKIGMDNWVKYLRKFGLGQQTGIDIDEESAGFVPDSKYYEKLYGPNWPRSIMASLGIGQGELSVTPIQLAKYVSLIANDGVTYTPHIVKGYIDNETKQMVPLKFKKIDVHINKKVFDIVKEGMFLVVNGEGTARWIKMDSIQIAGKTGTAQNPHGKDHALFIGFAPFNNPQIAFAVVIENVGFGATYAAPIAKKLVEAYLLKDKKENNPRITPEITQKYLGASIEN